MRVLGLIWLCSAHGVVYDCMWPPLRGGICGNTTLEWNSLTFANRSNWRDYPGRSTKAWTDHRIWLGPKIRHHCVPANITRDGALVSMDACHHGTLGVLLARFSDRAERSLLLRVGGPHPQTAFFDRVADPWNAPNITANDDYGGIWMARFRLCRPGRYTLHVLLVAVVDVSQELVHQCTSLHSREAVILEEMPIVSAARTDNMPECEADLWSWVTTSSSKLPSITGMLSRITTAQPFKRWRDPGLRTLRFGSITQKSSTDQPARIAAARQPLCLVGDSTVRQHVNTFAEMTSGKACDPVAHQRNHSVCATTSIHYFADKWGDALLHHLDCLSASGHNVCKDVLKEWSTLGACRTLLVNVGTWHASHHAPKYFNGPFTPDAYADKVDAILQLLARTKRARPGMHVAWMSTLPKPLNDGTCPDTRHPPRRMPCTKSEKGHYVWSRDLTACPPEEWSLPRLLREYNERARALSISSGIDYLDLWQPAFDLLDVSPDSQHYIGSPIAPILWHLISHHVNNVRN